MSHDEHANPPAAPIGAEHESPTLTNPAAGPSRAGSFSSGFVAAGRERQLPAGTLIAGRFRVIDLLGAGGMGAVYRADDLRVGQTIALKLLGGAAGGSGSTMADMQNEVRIARQITHPNVCRVHDLGEFDGHPYLTMEYIDGEPLSSLLKRIGRLAPQKALEIGQQLCAALAAAHAQGIVHRDLKPSNVMLDGRGRVRITDFGLAGVVDQLRGSGSRAGTPAYMSPEQMSGDDITAQSDIYALGLVLYELFTGQRAFEGRSPAELARARREPPPPPGSMVPDLDPAIDRVILQCLDEAPASRPRSVIDVAAALPGGDAVRATLAAGLTPSPQMVAAVGGVGALSMPVVAALAIFVVLGALLIASVITPAMRFGAQPPAVPPEVLADRARQTLSALGHEPALFDRAYGFQRGIAQPETALGELAGVNGAAPPVLRFWYRESPRPLRSERWSTQNGRVSLDDPPRTQPGMRSVELDVSGRLLRLHVVPDEEGVPGAAAGEPDWPALFQAAGLDWSAAVARPAKFVPDIFCEQRFEWTLSARADPTRDWVVRAAAIGATPVFWAVQVLPAGVSASAPHTAAVETAARNAATASQAVGFLLWLGLTVLAPLVLAQRNLRLGRGDRRGAVRLAGAILAASIVLVLTQGTIGLDVSGTTVLTMNLCYGAFNAALGWLLYLAVEPAMRRHWPTVTVGWARLMAGNWNDPRVGRDVLVAIGVAVGLILTAQVLQWAFDLRDQAVGRLTSVLMPDALLGPRHYLFLPLHVGIQAVFVALSLLLTLVLLRMVLRRNWAAEVVFGLILLVSGLESLSAGETPLAFQLIFGAINAATVLLVLTRLGLLSFFCVQTVAWLVNAYPMTLDFSAFYAGAAVTALALIVIPTLAAARITVASPRERTYVSA